jgi:hypothetical protein
MMHGQKNIKPTFYFIAVFTSTACVFRNQVRSFREMSVGVICCHSNLVFLIMNWKDLCHFILATR